MSPFEILGPTVISFSGGKTSAYMLRRVIEANGGRLPDSCVALFANTGKEHPATLDFVERCSQEWGAPIVWLERRGRTGYEVVNHRSASRNGEPFAELMLERNRPPNVMQRFCTQELKIATMERFCRDRFKGNSWITFVGLRKDEPERVNRIRRRCGGAKWSYQKRAPLYEAGVTQDHVMEFWKKQPFKLDIPQHLANCDMCFLKGQSTLLNVARSDPSQCDWWAEQEAILGSTFHNKDRLKGQGYKGLKAAVEAEQRGECSAEMWYKKQPHWYETASIEELFGDLSNIECGCTD